MADIVEQIDAAISGLCACGCNRQLDEHSPSVYFATEDCQRLWHAHRAPARRRLRGDADRFMDGITTRPADNITTRPERPRRAGSAAPAPRTSDTPNVSQLLRAGWRHASSTTGVQWLRWCEHCRDHAQPVDGVRAPHITAAWLDPDPMPEVMELERVTICPHCRQAFPGPPMAALWQRSDWDIQLCLVAGNQGVRHAISPERLRHDTGALAHTWQQLEHTLLRNLAPRCPIDGCDQPVGEGVTRPFTMRRPIEFAGRWWEPGEHHWCGRHYNELRRQLLTAEPPWMSTTVVPF